MENLSHSRPLSKSSTSLSKKSCNATNFMTKTTYDDVYGGTLKFGAPTLAPRVDDYTEIFGGFHAPRASSIPVLDLPTVDKDDIFFDVQSSGFDYDRVFAGIDFLDCAVSFQELMMDQSKGFNGDVDSCDEAWSPVETDSLSEGSDQSGKNLSVSNRDSHESTDGSLEFSISYNKVSVRNDEDMPNRITHVQIHPVPGYSSLVDKTTPLEKSYNENPPLEVADDNNLHMGSGRRMVRAKNFMQTLTQGSAGSSGEQAFADVVKPQSAFGRSSSVPNETFVTISEISLRTRPSEVPPPHRPAPLFDVILDHPANISENCQTTACEGRFGDMSPFCDVDVDESSSAAVSVASIKETMEKAQAKLKTSNELLEKKRKGFQSCKHDRNDTDKERVCGPCERPTNGITFSVREERPRDAKPLKAVPDSPEGENMFPVDESLAERHGPLSKTVGEWKEATDFFELVKTDGSTFEHRNYGEVLGLDAEIQDRRKSKKEVVEHRLVNGRTIETKSEEPRGNEKKPKAAKEACQWPESIKKLGTDKTICKHKGDEKRVKVAQEVCNQVEEESELRTVQHYAENEKKSIVSDFSEKHENLVKVQDIESNFEGRVMKHRGFEQPLRKTSRSLRNETSFNESCDRTANGRTPIEDVELIENEKKVKALEKEDKAKMFVGGPEVNEKRLVEIYEIDESKRKGKEAFELMESENQRASYEQEETEKRALEQEAYEKQQMEGHEKKDNDRRLNGALQKEERERIEKETSNGEETERRFQEVLDIEKMERRLKEAREKEETEKRLVQVCEEGDNCGTLYGRKAERKLRSKEALEKEERWSLSNETRGATEKRFKDAGESNDLKEINKAHEQNHWDGCGKKQKIAEGPRVFKDSEDLMLSDKARRLDDNVNLRDTRLSGQNEEDSKKGEVIQWDFAYEGKIEIQIEKSDGDIEGKVVETIDVVNDRKFKVFGMVMSTFQQEEYIREVKDFAEPLSVDHCVPLVGESGTGIAHDKTMNGLQLDSGTKNEVEKYTNERGEKEINVNQTQVKAGLTWKLNKDKIMPTQLVKESAQNGRKMEAALQLVLGAEGNRQKTSQLANASHRSEKGEKNINEALASEDIEAGRIRKEREIEIERRRRIEEEREREREKDRMAVDLATLEARKKSYGEARERAERAAVEKETSEVRQGALAGARKRLEKACAEAKEKSLAEKVYMETRLRAEHTAVERATAEARERAAEKTMAERAILEARERVMDRTFCEKFSASYRDGAL